LEESVELPLGVFAPVEPLGEVVVLELGLVDEEVPVAMSLPASAPRARGSASGRRPWVESVEPGDAPGLVRLPTPLPPPLSLHALTPASIAAAAANVTHLRIVMDVLVEWCPGRKLVRHRRARKRGAPGSRSDIQARPSLE